jgi:ribosomal protein S18 acetylase RimI-like enzyme
MGALCSTVENHRSAFAAISGDFARGAFFRRDYDARMTARPTLAVRRAGLGDLDALAPLFDAYRRFYEQPADLARARVFLQARLERAESVIFVAEIDTGADSASARAGLRGFCQLYPTWCSVAAAPIFVLYDLFVDDRARRGGVGRALMLAAQAWARDAGAARLDLSTAHANTRAQALYESLGWQRDETFRTYSLPLSAA